MKRPVASYKHPPECPLPQLIAERANDHPEVPFFQPVAGKPLAYAEFHERNLEWAAAFHAIGVKSSEPVITMLPASGEAHHAWLGLAWLGAVEVPINHEYKGYSLRHAVKQSGAKIVVASARFVDRFEAIANELDDDLLLVVPDGDDPASGIQLLTRSAFFGLSVTLPALRPPAPHDIACILFTSGTTGPSKGVRVPWRQLYYTAICPPDDALGRDEGFYSTWPAYHASGKCALFLPAIKRARLVAREIFSASSFWKDVREYHCTFALLGGPLVHFLLDRPPRADDASQPLRGIWSSPLSHKTIEFGRRFGARISTAFGMTEIGTPISSGGWVTDHWESCGRPRQGPPGFEVRIADEHDESVPVGAVGELVVRTEQPWALNAGYHGLPERTGEAWRNGWFHTGDAFRMDQEGRLYFVDRRKDCIRRRGENISSFEVERYVLEHPDISECAAIGVPSEYGEEEVKICAVPSGIGAISHEDLFEFLVTRMPRFMVPRYIEFYAGLPKTQATLRVKKTQLREQPVNEGTWDRERAGLEVPRDV